MSEFPGVSCVLDYVFHFKSFSDLQRESVKLIKDKFVKCIFMNIAYSCTVKVMSRYPIGNSKISKLKGDRKRSALTSLLKANNAI